MEMDSKGGALSSVPSALLDGDRRRSSMCIAADDELLSADLGSPPPATLTPNARQQPPDASTSRDDTNDDQWPLVKQMIQMIHPTSVVPNKSRMPGVGVGIQADVELEGPDACLKQPCMMLRTNVVENVRHLLRLDHYITENEAQKKELGQLSSQLTERATLSECLKTEIEQLKRQQMQQSVERDADTQRRLHTDTLAKDLEVMRTDYECVSRSLEQYKQLLQNKEFLIMQNGRKIDELAKKYKEAADLLKIHIVRADKNEGRVKKLLAERHANLDSNQKLKADLKRGGLQPLLKWAMSKLATSGELPKQKLDQYRELCSRVKHAPKRRQSEHTHTSGEAEGSSSADENDAGDTDSEEDDESSDDEDDAFAKQLEELMKKSPMKSHPPVSSAVGGGRPRKGSKKSAPLSSSLPPVGSHAARKQAILARQFAHSATVQPCTKMQLQQQQQLQKSTHPPPSAVKASTASLSLVFQQQIRPPVVVPTSDVAIGSGDSSSDDDQNRGTTPARVAKKKRSVASIVQWAQQPCDLAPIAPVLPIDLLRMASTSTPPGIVLTQRVAASIEDDRTAVNYTLRSLLDRVVALTTPETSAPRIAPKNPIQFVRSSNVTAIASPKRGRKPPTVVLPDDFIPLRCATSRAQSKPTAPKKKEKELLVAATEDKPTSSRETDRDTKIDLEPVTEGTTAEERGKTRVARVRKTSSSMPPIPVPRTDVVLTQWKRRRAQWSEASSEATPVADLLPCTPDRGSAVDAADADEMQSPETALCIDDDDADGALTIADTDQHDDDGKVAENQSEELEASGSGLKPAEEADVGDDTEELHQGDHGLKATNETKNSADTTVVISTVNLQEFTMYGGADQSAVEEAQANETKGRKRKKSDEDDRTTPTKARRKTSEKPPPPPPPEMVALVAGDKHRPKSKPKGMWQNLTSSDAALVPNTANATAAASGLIGKVTRNGGVNVGLSLRSPRRSGMRNDQSVDGVRQMDALLTAVLKRHTPIAHAVREFRIQITNSNRSSISSAQLAECVCRFSLSQLAGTDLWQALGKRLPPTVPFLGADERLLLQLLQHLSHDAELPAIGADLLPCVVSAWSNVLARRGFSGSSTGGDVLSETQLCTLVRLLSAAASGDDDSQYATIMRMLLWRLPDTAAKALCFMASADKDRFHRCLNTAEFSETKDLLAWMLNDRRSAVCKRARDVLVRLMPDMAASLLRTFPTDYLKTSLNLKIGQLRSMSGVYVWSGGVPMWSQAAFTQLTLVLHRWRLADGGGKTMSFVSRRDLLVSLSNDAICLLEHDSMSTAAAHNNGELEEMCVLVQLVGRLIALSPRALCPWGNVERMVNGAALLADRLDSNLTNKTVPRLLKYALIDLLRRLAPMSAEINKLLIRLD